MLMMMLLRRAIVGHKAVVSGHQMDMKEACILEGLPELGQCSVGLVGFGDIAHAVARRLKPFGCPLYYYAPHRRPPEVEADYGVTYLPLEELTARCDMVVLLCAVTPENRGMVDKVFLARMKPGAYLVNTARGDLVNNEDLRQALIQGVIAGAALDTIYPEPTPGDHPLVALPPEAAQRVIYSPHLGGITAGSFSRAHANMWNDVRLLLETGRPNPDSIVNGL